MLTEWRNDGITESRNHGMTDRLKTVYPPKTSFCGGYKQYTPLKLRFAGGIIMLMPLEIGCKQGFQNTPRKIIIVYKQWSRNGYVEKWCKFVKNNFFSIIIIHAHLQYVWNMSAKYWKEILKALGGVDFTNYALPTIIVYKQWSKNGYVKKCYKFVKNYFFHLTL